MSGEDTAAAEAALDEAVHAYKTSRAEAEVTGQDPAGVSALELQAAASAHLAASRDLETVKAEYDAMDAASHAGEPFDVKAYAVLGQELSKVRMAGEIAQGNLPGGTHVASARIGG